MVPHMKSKSGYSWQGISVPAFEIREHWTFSLKRRGCGGGGIVILTGGFWLDSVSLTLPLKRAGQHVITPAIPLQKGKAVKTHRNLLRSGC